MVMVVNPVDVVIVKLVLLISKKIFPTASTFTLAVVVEIFGTVIVWLPSFGVDDNNTVG